LPLWWERGPGGEGGAAQDGTSALRRAKPRPPGKKSEFRGGVGYTGGSVAVEEPHMSPAPTDPEALLLLARAGDAAACGRLLERELAGDLGRSSQALPHAVADPGTSPSDRAARREQAVLLADALGRLPEDYREVLVLRHLEGLTFPAIAERLGRSEDSVTKLW